MNVAEEVLVTCRGTVSMYLSNVPSVDSRKTIYSMTMRWARDCSDQPAPGGMDFFLLENLSHKDIYTGT